MKGKYAQNTLVDAFRGRAEYDDQEDHIFVKGRRICDDQKVSIGVIIGHHKPLCSACQEAVGEIVAHNQEVLSKREAEWLRWLAL